MLNTPFLQSGATQAVAKSLIKNSKFSFNGIISNIEKTVSTINQVVPLYNQIKPLISNSKTVINAFKSTRSLNQRKETNSLKKDNIDIINIQTEPSIIKNKEIDTDYDVFKTINTPNKPFFN